MFKIKQFHQNILGNICEITTGKLDANAMEENGKYRFYTCAKEHYYINSYEFDTEALLISGNGANVGYIHYYKGKFNAYQRTYVLKNIKIDAIYLKYFLDSKLEKRINREKNSGNTPYITMPTLYNMIIDFPLLPEDQKKIGSFLSAIDDLLSFQSNKIYNIEMFKKHFLNYFFLKLESFKKCEFREVAFNDLGELYSGYGFPEIYQGMETVEIPFFKVSDFNNLENSYVMLKSNNYIDKETAEELGIKVSREKGIVFAKLGAAISLNRKRILNKGSIVDNNMGYLIPSEKLDFNYVYQLILSLDFSQFVQATSVPSLSYSNLKTHLLKIHDTFNQEKIGLFLGLIDKLIMLEKKKEIKLKEIKEYYLKEIFNN